MNARFDQAIKLPNQGESDNRQHHNRRMDHIDTEVGVGPAAGAPVTEEEKKQAEEED